MIKNGVEKRIFRLEMIMYILLAKESLIPTKAIPDLIMQTWRVLF